MLLISGWGGSGACEGVGGLLSEVLLSGLDAGSAFKGVGFSESGGTGGAVGGAVNAAIRRSLVRPTSRKNAT